MLSKKFFFNFARKNINDIFNLNIDLFWSGFN